MKRIATPNRAVDKFAAGKDGFRAAVPAVSSATEFSDLWFNHVQEAVMRTIEQAGLVQSDTDFDQFVTALNATYARLSSAAFTVSPTALTPAQFDASQKLATTNFLKRVGVQFSGVLNINGANIVGVPAHVGGEINAVGTGAASSYTIPDSIANSIPVGSVIMVANISTSPFALSRQGTDQFFIYSSTGSNSISIPPGTDVLFTLISNGQWVVTGSGSFLNYTLQNVVASRAAGTVYTNSTGKPIYVSVTFSQSTNVSTTAVATAGVASFAGSTTTPVAGSVATVAFWVPAGATYSATTSGGTTTLLYWSEMR
ncbi:hypothetical protein [Undibacterium sp.]|uniref:hypothetical protein n=1 Tax=Undibacterium sp. TaxID=1914977 RepID=UPI0025ECD996|nr:hypothetical protein [Undibacterium sp.]